MSIYSCIDRIDKLLSGAQAKNLLPADREFFQSLSDELEELDKEDDPGTDTKFEFILSKIDDRLASEAALPKRITKELQEINSDLLTVRYGIGISSHSGQGGHQRIYSCIEHVIKLMSSDPKSTPLLPVDEKLLVALKTELTEIGLRYDAGFPTDAQLKAVLKKILSRITSEPALPKQVSLKLLDIFETLSFVSNSKGPLTVFEKKLEAQYEALLNSPLLLKPIQQGKMKEIGISKGECYGFSMSMADSTLSPYKGDRDIVFNRAIYNYQKYVGDRKKDHETIKRTRLTRLHFCPSLKEQASQLYKLASSPENIGKDLMVHLQCSLGGHATYLNIQADGSIRYMDPNHGAFLFKDKDQFISAYRLMYMHSANMNPAMAYKFYEVHLLEENARPKEKESITWSGKWRSFLTGGKYDKRGSAVVSVVVWASVGAVIGGFIGSVIPGIGTAIGFGVGAVIGGFLGEVIAMRAAAKGYVGLLGVYHYCRENIHTFSESIKGKLGIIRECDELPPLVIPERATLHETTMQNSTAEVIVALSASPMEGRHESEVVSDSVVAELIVPVVSVDPEKPVSHETGEEESPKGFRH